MSTSHAESRSWRPKDTLAHRVTLVRSELGLSQREAEHELGLARGAFQRIEAGRSARNEVALLTKVADTFGVDRDWLIWGGPLANENGGGDGTKAHGNAPVTDKYPTRLRSVPNITNGVKTICGYPETTNPQRSRLSLAG